MARRTRRTTPASDGSRLVGEVMIVRSKTQTRDGQNLACRVEIVRRPARLWTWAVVAKTGCFPYLNVSPQPRRSAAVELARDLNARARQEGIRVRYLARRVIYELHLPSEAESTPGLPISRRPSALGRL